MRPIAGAVIGLIVGLLLAFILVIPTCFIAAVATKSARKGDAAANALGHLIWIGAVIGFVVGIGLDVQKDRQLAEEEQSRYDAGAAAELAKRQAQGADQARKAAAAEETRKSQEIEARRRRALLQWSQELPSISVERLRFEYEKRQRSVGTLQTKLDRISREQSELWAQHERWINDDNATSYNPRVYTNLDEINRCEREIANTEEEMALIHAVLDSKWS
jgi:hypothetical protein